MIICGILKAGISLQDKSLSNGIFFLELLSAVEPRVVNWNLVTKGESGKILFAMFSFTIEQEKDFDRINFE